MQSAGVEVMKVSRRYVILGIAMSSAAFFYKKFNQTKSQILVTSDHIALKTYFKNSVISSINNPIEFGTNNVVILNNYLLPNKEVLRLCDDNKFC